MDIHRGLGKDPGVLKKNPLKYRSAVSVEMMLPRGLGEGGGGARWLGWEWEENSNCCSDAVQGNVVLLWQGFWDLREVSFVYTPLFQFPQMIVDDVVSVRLFVCD